jgi:uncharacterized protein
MSKDDRRCVSCRKIAPRTEFWRIVRCYPSKEVKIDVGDTHLEGRSAYLCPTVECLQIAQKKNRVGRSLKAGIPQDIYQRLLYFLFPTPNSQLL